MPNHLLTFELAKDGDELFIHADAEGLRYLAAELVRLAQNAEAGRKDHTHLMSEQWAGSELSAVPQDPGCRLLNQVTIHSWPTKGGVIGPRLNVALAFPMGPFDFPVGSNPYFNPDLLEIWRERITRLRRLTDMPAPWEIEPDAARWKRSLGLDEFLDTVLLEWQVWIRSLNPEGLLHYQAQHPEPHGFGFYQLTFRRPTAAEVQEDKGSEVYWNSLEKHYETVFGVA